MATAEYREDADWDAVPGPPMHDHTVGNWVGTATTGVAATTTTTWDDNTTITPGQLGDITTQPLYYYPYQGGVQVDKQFIKEALREVLAELAAQDESFTAWLKIKYMTIPVIPEGGNDDHVAKETVGEAR